MKASEAGTLPKKNIAKTIMVDKRRSIDGNINSVNIIVLNFFSLSFCSPTENFLILPFAYVKIGELRFEGITFSNGIF